MNIEEAKYRIQNAKEQELALTKIDSESGAGIWNQIVFVYATAAEFIYSQWESFRLQLENLVNTRRWATTAWYIEKAKEFQLGDMLEELPSGQFGYPVIDEEKQIIKQAAIDVSDRVLSFKVATETNGQLAKVDNVYMPLFKAYINQIKRPGTPMRFINYEPDLLAISLRIFFDGELVQDKVEEDIKSTINAYLKNLVFNGIFSVTKLIDELQKIQGLSECIWLSGKSWYDGQDETLGTIVEDRHKAASGYFKIEDEHLNLELIREL